MNPTHNKDYRIFKLITMIVELKCHIKLKGKDLRKTSQSLLCVG